MWNVKMFKPSKRISIDEHMIKNKDRYKYWQYIQDKPTKWGKYLADTVTYYTYDYGLWSLCGKER